MKREGTVVYERQKMLTTFESARVINAICQRNGFALPGCRSGLGRYEFANSTRSSSGTSSRVSPLGSFSLLRGQLALGGDARDQLLLRALVLRMDRCLHAICRKNDPEALTTYGKGFLQH